MIKRSTKIASLLVCAASIISIMPVMADDIQTIGTQEGAIYNAKSKGGLFYIEGEINDQDEAQYYVGKDGIFNKLDTKVDSDYYVNDLLKNQYLELADKETYLDVKDSYKEVNVSREEFINDVERTLKKKIKHDNDDRFLKSDYEDSALQEIKDYTDTEAGDLLSAGSGLSIIKYHLKNSDELESEGIDKSTSAIYTDYDGIYVDADYNIGSLRVTTTTGGAVTINNTEDVYDTSAGYQYKAVISEPTSYKGYITETNGSVYRWANLSIYGKKESESTWTNITSEVGFGMDGYKLDSSSFNSDGSVTVLHTFTRTTPATDTIDGINYAKDASIHFIADKNGNSEYVLGRPKHDGVTDANEKVGAATDGSTKFVVSKDSINSDYYDTTNDRVYSEKITLKTKNGFQYMDIGDDESVDDVTQWADTGGVIYVLSNGYLKAWNSSTESFDKTYKVDSAMNNMIFIDKDNFLVWNSDKDIYSIVTKPSAATTEIPVTTVTTGASVTKEIIDSWIKNSDNTWSYVKEDGEKAIGWLLYEDNWYYLNESGTMLYNTTIDGYELGENGEWIQ